MKLYHMVIQRGDDPSTRREYIHQRQGAAPAGWKCVGVCGYHETPKKHPDDLQREEAAEND